MPVQYQFVRRSDGQAESLMKVDEEICAMSNRTVHPIHYCPLFQEMIDIVMLAESRSHASYTEESIIAAMDYCAAEYKDDTYADAEVRRIILHFVIHQYRLDMWRGH